MRRLVVTFAVARAVSVVTTTARPTVDVIDSSSASPTSETHDHVPPTPTDDESAVVHRRIAPTPGRLAEPDPHRPRYEASVNVDPPSSTVTGSMVVTFTPDLPVDELVFRLWANAPVPAASGAHLAVEQATAVPTGDAPLPTTLSDPTTLHVAISSGANTAMRVRLAFTLTVPRNNDDRVAHAGDTMRLGSFLPLLAWEPGVGWATEPATAIHGEAATSPVADYDVEIAVPAGYDVLGTGVRDADNHWRATAVRDVAFSVGHFDIAEQDVAGVHVTVGVDRSVGEDPHHDLALIADALPQVRSAVRRVSVARLHGRDDAWLQRRHRVPAARDARTRLAGPVGRPRARAPVVLLTGRQRSGA